MKTAQKLLIPIALALFSLAPPLCAQDFDMRALDKLGANAKSTVNVTLNRTMLKFASAVLGNGGDSDSAAIKSLIANLRAISVRVYQYDAPGQYAEADLAPLRAMLSQPKWTAVVDVKDGRTTNQIYFEEGVNDKLGGVAVITEEPKALTVIYIDGELDPADIAKLSGNLGIPDIQHLDDLKIRVRPDIKKDDNKSKKSK